MDHWAGTQSTGFAVRVSADSLFLYYIGITNNTNKDIINKV